MNEIWKDIVGYEGLYQVSNLGRVKSLNYRRSKKEEVRKLRTNCFGYLQVKLWKNGEWKMWSVHRLVALHFVDGWFEGAVVNHIDEDKQNNVWTNLEFVTQEYNVQYSTPKRVGKHHHSEEWKQGMSECNNGGDNPNATEVICITTGEVFDCIRSASDYYNCNYAHIGGCCRGERKSCGKLEDGTRLVWKYYEDYLKEKEGN